MERDRSKPHRITKADLLPGPLGVRPDLRGGGRKQLSREEVGALVASVHGRMPKRELNLRDESVSVWKGFGLLGGGDIREGEGDAEDWVKVGMWEYGRARELDADGQVVHQTGQGQLVGGGSWGGVLFFGMVVGLWVLWRVKKLRRGRRARD